MFHITFEILCELTYLIHSSGLPLFKEYTKNKGRFQKKKIISQNDLIN